MDYMFSEFYFNPVAPSNTRSLKLYLIQIWKSLNSNQMSASGLYYLCTWSTITSKLNGVTMSEWFLNEIYVHMSHQVSNNMVVWMLSAINPKYPKHDEHHGSGVHQGTDRWFPTFSATTRVKARRLWTFHLSGGWERKTWKACDFKSAFCMWGFRCSTCRHRGVETALSGSVMPRADHTAWWSITHTARVWA